jgi:alanine racemase
MPPANLRLTIDTATLAANWCALDRASGAAACGAAVKADGYGLGASAVVLTLVRAGCRDFFVASWAEAAALDIPAAARLAVLHGVQDGEMRVALASAAVPVLCTPAQVAAWRAAAPGRVCDVMIDTGMNRLGLEFNELNLLDGLTIDTIHSHLACADTPCHPMNARQLAAFREVVATVPAKRASLANSCGIMLGPDYAFGLTRPGIGLYGGAVAGVAPVAGIEARVVQVRDIAAGDSVGYGATWTAARATRVAVLNIGYADGYPCSLSNGGSVFADDATCPVIGRVSMDLVAADVTGADVREGDWLRLDFDLPRAAAASGRSQYELLTGLSHRYARRYQ